MKTCQKCKVSKSLTEFNKRTGRKGVKHICTICYRAASRDHYRNNRAAYYGRGEARRKLIRNMIAAIKKQPCADCGASYPPYVMDLDHLDPASKEITPARLAGSGWPMKRIEAEIAKCEVVCSNCHRERTHGKPVMGREMVLTSHAPVS